MTINRRGTAKHPKPKTKELKMSNIGELTKNTNGFYIGKIDTLAVAMTLALREVHSTNENAPVYEIHARSAAGSWVKVGALWEQTSNGTGEAFLQGSIDDPSMVKPLYIACFRREDESYAIAWSRPRRTRNDVPAPANQGEGDSENGEQDFDGSPAKQGKTQGKAKSKKADLGETTSDAAS
ncbi:DUF736 domain-containing protein [Parasphingorhabdus sp. NYA22]